VDRVRRDGLGQPVSAAVVGRAEEGTAVLGAVANGLQIDETQRAGCRVQRHVADLAARARHRLVSHPQPIVFEVLDLQGHSSSRHIAR